MRISIRFGLLVCRLALALGVVLGSVAVRGSVADDPALELARVAGALCLGGGAGGVPVEHRHDQCMVCQGVAPGVATASLAVEMPRAAVVAGARVALSEWRGTAGQAAYSSRAPPSRLG